MKFALFVFFLASVSAFGQVDAGALAAQQAQQQGVQANQQAIDSMQQLSQQTTINNLQMQLNMANASSPSSGSCPIVGSAIQPTFSVKQGKVNSGTQVSIKSATHYATIYYTTDGWKPTKASNRYTGPIVISADTHFQAIAVGPNLTYSSVARADYTVNGPATASIQQPSVITDGVLRAGTELRLMTSSEISSQTAEVGDKIPLLLDQDLKVGDAVVATKGTQVDAILTAADPAAKYYVPGDLTFQVRSLTVQGKTLSLSGGETLEGAAGRKPKEAVIEPGMIVTASLTADTTMKP